MAYAQQNNFWDWVRSLDDLGAGVDHPRPPFDGPPPPPPPPFGHGRRGRHCGPPPPPPPRSREGSLSGGEGRDGPPFGFRPGCGHGRRGWGGRHRHEPPPPFAYAGPGAVPFDLTPLFNAFQGHPWAQAMRGFAEQGGFVPLQDDAQRSGEAATATAAPQNDAEQSFEPPIDVFNTEKEYVLHVALPGVKKEDVGVNWDAEKGVLNLAGVVYRQGDEEFLKKLSKAERKVGVFERIVKLPPNGEEKEEVDSDGITAKLEDGVLVVVVPKLEKEWVELKRVDIE